jgi:DNA-binding IclR family transcriptional regulator
VTGRGRAGPGPGRDARDVPRDALRDSPLRRLLLLLESFDNRHTELTLTELSRRSGLPLTTTHRMTGELTAAGVLERTAAGRYRVGLRLWEIAALAPRALGLRETAFPFLEDLFLAVRENVLLAVRDGDEVVFVDKLSAHGAVPVLSFLGRRRSMHSSSAGLVLLAHAEPELQERVLARPLRRYTEKTLVDPVALRSELDRVRRCGYAIADGHLSLSAVSAAAPVRDDTDAVIGTIGVVLAAGGTDVRRVVPAVVAAARGVSRALGAPSAQRGRRPGGGQPRERAAPL